MSKTLAIATRRETSPRVQPRRRGEATPTTLAAPREGEMRALRIESQAVAKTPTLLVVPPKTMAQVSPTSPSERPHASFEALADALTTSAENSTFRSIALLTVTRGENAERIVARVADVLNRRKLVRVRNLNEDPRFADACRELSAEAGSPRGERFARQQIRALLDEFRGQPQIVLCAGGPASSRLGAVLGQLNDACYVVVELGKTPSAQARLAANGLRHSGASVLGCIVVE